MAPFDRDRRDDIYQGFDGRRASIEQSPQIDALETRTIPPRDWRPTPRWLDRANNSPLIRSRLSGMEPSSYGAVHVNSVNFPNIELEYIEKFESDQKNDQQWTTEKYYTPRSSKDNLRELDPATLYAADILMLQRPVTCPGTNYALYTKPDLEKGQNWKNPKGFNQIKGKPDLSRISVNPHPQLSTLPDADLFTWLSLKLAQYPDWQDHNPFANIEELIKYADSYGIDIDTAALRIGFCSAISQLDKIQILESGLPSYEPLCQELPYWLSDATLHDIRNAKRALSRNQDSIFEVPFYYNRNPDHAISWDTLPAPAFVPVVEALTQFVVSLPDYISNGTIYSFDTLAQAVTIISDNLNTQIQNRPDVRKVFSAQDTWVIHLNNMITRCLKIYQNNPHFLDKISRRRNSASQGDIKTLHEMRTDIQSYGARAGTVKGFERRANTLIFKGER